MLSSSRNSISDNDIEANGLVGIILSWSSNNVLSNNRMSENRYNLGVDGGELSHFIHDIDSSNTVDGKPVYYWINRQNEKIPADAGYVALINSINIRVENINPKNNFEGLLLVNTQNSLITSNYITSNAYGICLLYSSNNNRIYGNNITANTWLGIRLEYSSNNNNVYDNNITASQHGIGLLYSSSNNIFGNNIVANGYNGIRLEQSSTNAIFHNNFVDNPYQAYSDLLNVWDDGYPSGGNYWSDYTGVDLKWGSDQDRSGSDGIGDTAYVIDGNNRDRYPLMKPYSGLYDIGITNITMSKTVVGQGYNLTISMKILNYGIIAEAFNLTIYANKTIVQTITNVLLVSRGSTIITFTWNTSGFAEGNYTISAVASTVYGETDTTDNMCVDGWVRVSMIGDVSGEPGGTGWGLINIFDVVTVASRYGSRVGDSNWNPNADLSGEPNGKGWGLINIFDVVTVCARYGQKDP